MAMSKKKIVLEDGRYLIYYMSDEKAEAKQAERPAEKCSNGKCHGGAK